MSHIVGGLCLVVRSNGTLQGLRQHDGDGEQ
jgi:hypothetical protein